MNLSLSSLPRVLLVLVAAAGLAALAGCDDDAATEQDTADMTGSDVPVEDGVEDSDVPVEDSTDATGEDVTTPDGDTAPDPDVGPGTILVESPTEEDEFRDCLVDCGHEGPPFTWNWRTSAGLRGYIDNRCHQLRNFPYAPDIDWIGLTASPRSLVEITVQPEGGSRMDPLVETHTGVFTMTFNDDRAEGDKTARTVVAGPFLNDLPFYLIVQDSTNYNALDPHATDCSRYVGGPDYGYLVTVRELPFEPTDLGTIPPGGHSTTDGRIERPGDIQYFTFTAPATAAPTVTLTRTGSNAMLLHAAGMNTIQGQASWSFPRSDEAGIGSLVLEASDFDVCRTGCDGIQAEYMFAVTDWNGWGGPDFTFDVRVEL